MIVENTAGDVLAVISALQQARAACADLKPLGSRMTATEMDQRAAIIATVVRTRRLLRMLQNRADDPGDAAGRLHPPREARRA